MNTAFQILKQARSLIVLALIMPGFSAAADAMLPVEAFGKNEAISDVQLSPDGTHYAALQWIDGQVALAVFNPGGKKPYDVISLDISKDIDEAVQSIFWMSDDRIGVIFQFLELRREATPVMQARLLSIDKDLNDIQFAPNIDKATSWTIWTSVQQHSIFDMLWDDPDHILMNLWSDLYKVNIKNGNKEIYRKDVNAVGYMADQTGKIRIRYINDQNDGTVMVLNLETEKWDVLTKGEKSRNNKKGVRREFDPEIFAADPNVLWISKRDKDSYSEILEFDLKSMSTGRKIFGVPGHDVGDVRGDLYTRGILGVRYAMHYNTLKYSDPEIAQVQATLDGALASTRNYITSYDRSRRKFVVFATSPRHPGKYYLYDKQTGSIQKLLDRMPVQMPASELADMEPISYKARDGLDIPAYLTRPKGAGPFPMVVLPHDGPIARDYQEYGYWTQFLASRGYAVLQPQFRGSDGYGRDFQQAGKHQWGLAMQDDITDGAREMIARGIADPGRICIVGASYGGYAALMGAVKTPDLFQCAVSFAGVSDIGAWVRYGKERYDWPDDIHHIGSIYDEGRQLRDTSPIYNIDPIKVPILLVHGDKDVVVPPDQSTRMAKKLKKEGKPHKLVILKGGSHGLVIERNRIRFLKELEAFLGKHIGE